MYQDKKLLSPRLTAGQLPLKEFIEVRILGGQLKNFFLKKFGKWKTLSYLCIVIEGKGGRVSSLTLWKPKKWTESWDSAFNSQVAELVDADRWKLSGSELFVWLPKRVNIQVQVLSWLHVPKQTTDSVPNMMRNGVMSVWERTLVYRQNTRASQPDLVRTNDYS